MAPNQNQTFVTAEERYEALFAYIKELVEELEYPIEAKPILLDCDGIELEDAA